MQKEGTKGTNPSSKKEKHRTFDIRRRSKFQASSDPQAGFGDQSKIGKRAPEP